jgi:hypothetical protein
MKKRLALLLAIVASAYLAGALGFGEESASFSADWRCAVTLGADAESIAFTPDVNSLYDVAVFPSDGSTVESVWLTRGGRVIASGDGALISLTARLTAGQSYALTIAGTGDCVVELMRRTAGRSASMPEEIEGGAAAGIIVRTGNAAWYSFEGTGGLTTVYVTPDDGAALSMTALVYKAGGTRAAESVFLPDGACAAYLPTVAGEKYLVRVAAPTGGSGKYTVYLASDAPGTEAPTRIELLTGDLSMRAGTMRSARVSAYPSTAAGTLVWRSSDPAVAEVSPAGLITAREAGEAVVSVYGYGGLSASINVSVSAVEPEDIFYFDAALQLSVGDERAPELTVYPAAASDAEFEYSSSAPEVASVSDAGVISALSEGTAVVTATYGDLAAEIEVTVGPAPARHRALLIGEHLYASDVNSVRKGSVNTVYNLESLLNTVTYDGGVKCETTVELDLTRDGFLQAISDAFSGAKEDDVSILYVSAHGYFRDGMSILQMIDGSEIPACDLERALRKIPGTIVLLVDCCDSGGFIGTYGETDGFASGVVAAFSGEAAPFGGSKYKVLASASLMQDSYRIGYGDNGDESGTATAFARALCDGSGWDMDDQRKGALSADTDYSGQVTLWETYLYTSRRVHWYLSVAGDGAYAQDVQVYPKGDNFVLFDWQE